MEGGEVVLEPAGCPRAFVDGDADAEPAVGHAGFLVTGLGEIKSVVSDAEPHAVPDLAGAQRSFSSSC